MKAAHPAAEILPPMSAEEYEALKADIAENGQREPIVVDKAGKIIDGRHRARACAELGLIPSQRQYEGKDIESFVLSANLHRRNLLSGQRAMVAGRMARRLMAASEERRRRKISASRQEDSETGANLPPSQRPRDEAGAALGVGGRSVQTAMQVEDADAELAQQVWNGETTLNGAATEIKRRAETAATEKDAERHPQAVVVERNGKVYRNVSAALAPVDWSEAAQAASHEKDLERLIDFAGSLRRTASLIDQAVEDVRKLKAVSA